MVEGENDNYTINVYSENGNTLVCNIQTNERLDELDYIYNSFADQLNSVIENDTVSIMVICKDTDGKVIAEKNTLAAKRQK